MRRFARFEFKGHKRPRHVAGIGDLLSVEPNVSAVIDAQQMQPLRCSWWFRTEFSLPSDHEGATKWLHLLGINYRANVWLNGQKIADVSDVAGKVSNVVVKM